MRLSFFVYLFTFAVGVMLFWLMVPDVLYLPSFLNLLTGFIVVWSSFSIRNVYARNVCLFWTIWFLLGSISLFAQNQVAGGLNYNLDPEVANQFYLCCILAATAVMNLTEKIFAVRMLDRPVLLGRDTSKIIWIFLLIFPILYAFSIIVATGTVPLFSGRNVSSEMYEVDYGPLHGFGVFISVACIMLWVKIGGNNSIVSRQPFKPLALGLLILFILIAAMDGRRAFAIFALFGIIFFSIAQPGGVSQKVRIGTVAALALLGYVAAAAIRTGLGASQAFADIYQPLSTIGTEYRDYIYGFVRVSRQDVAAAGYDWLGSTIATLIPGGALSAFGLDKATILQSDSARTLMQFWNVNLGIRIGLPGELWFEYGWWGVAIFAAFGLIVIGTAMLAARTNHFAYRAILLTVLTLWATAVLGQSTVTFGLVLPLLYLMIFVRVTDGAIQRLRGRL